MVNKKRRVFSILCVSLYLVVVLLTVGLLIMDSYRRVAAYGDDDKLGRALEPVMVLMVMIPLLMVETETFSSIHYFALSKNKKRYKTIFHILLFLLSVIAVVSLYCLFRERFSMTVMELLVMISTCLWFLGRICYMIMSSFSYVKDN